MIALLLGDSPLESPAIDWISTPAFSLDFHLHLDGLSATIGLLISGFFLAFMARHRPRAQATDRGNPPPFDLGSLALLLFACLITVMAGNLPLIFVGLEAMALFSFLLLGPQEGKDSQRPQSTTGFFIDRLGTLGFLLALISLYHRWGSLDFSPLATHFQSGSANPGPWLCLLGLGLPIALNIAPFTQRLLRPQMASIARVDRLFIPAAIMGVGSFYLLARLHFLGLAPGIWPLIWLLAGGIFGLFPLITRIFARAQNGQKTPMSPGEGLPWLKRGVGLVDWVVFKAVDRAILDGMVNGMGTVARTLGQIFSAIQSGDIQVYLFLFASGLMAVMGILYWM